MNLGDVAELPLDVPCDSTDQYVKSLGLALPVTHELITAMPVNFAREAVQNLTSPQELALWQEHVASVYETLDLTVEQTEFVEAFLQRQTPLGDDRAVEAYMTEAESVLAREHVFSLFVNLQTGGSSSSKSTPFDPTGGGAPQSIEPGGGCNCATTSDWCDPWGLTDFTCFGGGCSQSGGCGTFWRHRCNGGCGI